MSKARFVSEKINKLKFLIFNILFINIDVTYNITLDADIPTASLKRLQFRREANLTTSANNTYKSEMVLDSNAGPQCQELQTYLKVYGYI